MQERLWPIFLLLVWLGLGCQSPSGPTGPDQELGPISEQGLIAEGRRVFFNETFGGNGRTCATCHPGPTFALNPQRVARLRLTDPGNPLFRRKDDLEERFVDQGLTLVRLPSGQSVFRAAPALLNLSQTAPYNHDGRTPTLREQNLGAMRFEMEAARDPSERELAALEAFQRSLTNTTPVRPGSDVARLGEQVFNRKGRCSICHNPGHSFAEARRHDTGVEGDPHRLSGLPPDPGPFNTAQLRDVGSTGPYFHNNSRRTLRDVVLFYDSDLFASSPAARALGISALNLNPEEIDWLVAFLESL